MIISAAVVRVIAILIYPFWHMDAAREFLQDVYDLNEAEATAVIQYVNTYKDGMSEYMPLEIRRDPLGMTLKWAD